MGHLLAVRGLLILVEKRVEVELGLQILKTTEGEALAWTIGRDREDFIESHVVLPDGRDIDDRLFCLLALKDLKDTTFVQLESPAVIPGQRKKVLHIEVLSDSLACLPPPWLTF